MTGARRRRRKVLALLAVAALAGGIGVLAYATNVLNRSELQTLDARYSIRGDSGAPSNIVFVAIDVKTLLALRRDYPFPRRWDARVIDHLREAGAQTIAVDMDFSIPTNEVEDDELYEAVARAHGKTVLAATNVEADGNTEVLGGSRNLREAGARAGEDHLVPDTDGATRRFAREYNHLASFPVAAAEVMSGRRYPSSLFEGGTLPIDFAGPPETFHTIPYEDVLRGQFPKAAVQGKLVVVGASAPILGDNHLTAMGGEMPGAEIWANAISTLLRGVPLRGIPGWINVALVLLLGAAVPLGSLGLQRWRVAANALALAVLFTIAVQVAFDDGRIVTLVYPMLALVLGTLGTLGVLYAVETIERARVHDLFARFVPADVVDQVVASAGENLRLGAVERDCTVLFSDLRGFTSFSEKLPATRVIEVVNCYLNEMTEAILGAGGTLISYMGDGIMAVFGAPLEQPDHADRALAAASEMIGARLDAFNAWIARNGHDHRFAMGVGLNSGPVMAGNIGSERRVEYTALGDTTNTASRLEGMTKGSGHMLFIADTTRERMQRPPDDLVLVGELEVRGRVAPVPVWTIAERDDAAAATGTSAEGVVSAGSA
ncbi:MAG TPA: adenylate/guanylate cyclase domain-containing protein [Solirubrobacteraceae bacterium]|nr:adenylate/guanylate cyclase domain-containing protein [Solirubrobacteraceae bacterium]